MLYDRRWDAKVETKADPFSLESLIAWLEKQPADMSYHYYDIRGCLICKYLDGLKIKYHSAGCEDFAPAAGEARIGLPGWGGVTQPQPWTFGAALERARKIAQS